MLHARRYKPFHHMEDKAGNRGRWKKKREGEVFANETVRERFDLDRLKWVERRRVELRDHIARVVRFLGI